VQFCVPYRRLMFTGWERARFGGGAAEGQVTITAAEVTSAGLVPRPRSGESETIWDVEATDSTGRTIVSLRHLHMRDAGALPRSEPWPVPLAACLLERGAAELGLSPGLQVRLWRRADVRQPTSVAGWTLASAAAAAAGPGLGGLGGSVGLAEHGGLAVPAGLDLAVRAEGPAACGWRLARGAARAGSDGPDDQAGRWLDRLGAERLPGAGAEGRSALARAIAACTGFPADLEVTAEVRPMAGADWLLLGFGGTRVVCVLLDLAGVGAPVAIAIMTGEPDRPGQPGFKARQNRVSDGVLA